MARESPLRSGLPPELGAAREALFPWTVVFLRSWDLLGRFFFKSGPPLDLSLAAADLAGVTLHSRSNSGQRPASSCLGATSEASMELFC